MVDFTAPVFWFFFLLTGLALFVLRFKAPHVARPFKVPGYPILPLVFIGTCGFLLYRSLMFTLQNQAVQAALYVMAAGVVAWIIARLKKTA
jgi:amino acid transporter